MLKEYALLSFLSVRTGPAVGGNPDCRRFYAPVSISVARKGKLSYAENTFCADDLIEIRCEHCKKLVITREGLRRAPDWKVTVLSTMRGCVVRPRTEGKMRKVAWVGMIGIGIMWGGWLGYASFGYTIPAWPFPAPVGQLIVGKQYTVTWTAPAGHPVDDDIRFTMGPSTEVTAGIVQPLGSATSGTFTFVVPFELGHVAKGSIGIYSKTCGGQGFGCLATGTSAFTAVKGNYSVSLPLNMTTVFLGQPITVTWTAPAGHSTADKIVMASVGAAANVYGDSQAVSADTMGAVILRPLQNLGQNEVRYLAANGTIKSRSGPLTVVQPPTMCKP